jgi:predicted ester cyclase
VNANKVSYGRFVNFWAKVTLSVIKIDRIAGGKLVKDWSRFDTLGMMQRLGLAPAPGKGK